MPMVNRFEIIGNLVGTPELGLTEKGVPYCVFNIKFVQRTPDNSYTEEFMPFMAYSKISEVIGTELYTGDLVYLAGHMTIQVTEQHFSNIVLVADQIEKLATGKGYLPPVTMKDLAYAQPIPFVSGEDPFVHAKESRRNGIDKANLVPHSEVYPQPCQNIPNAWIIPKVINERTKKWLESRGYSEQEFSEMRNKIKQSKAVLMNSKEADPIERFVSTLVPFYLKPTNGIVYLPEKNWMQENAYKSLISSQHEFIARQPYEIQLKIIEMASKRGIKLDIAWFDKELASQRQELSKLGTKAKLEQEADNSIAYGGNADEWYQDKNGEWHKKE